MHIAELTSLVLTHLSLVSCLWLAWVTNKRSRGYRLGHAFLALIAIMVIWNIGTLLEYYTRLATGRTHMLFIYMCYFGIFFIPIAILYLGKILSQPDFQLTPAYAAFLVIPVTSMIVICTNDYHHLFFQRFSLYSSEAVYGRYYYFHSVYSYGCILVGIAYLVAFSVRNSGIFSTQSALICIGILAPLTANILYSFALFDLSFSINSSMFTITTFCFAVALQKYDFLTVVPIAVQHVVDLISDGYLVIDGQNRIVGCNKAVFRLLPGLTEPPAEAPLEDFFAESFPPGFYGIFSRLYAQSVEERCTFSIESHSIGSEDRRHFDVEITPVFQNNLHVGGILLLKDITQAKRDLETIKETQAIMIERERLASLGQMVGGIAHNLKTPILSISGGVEALRDLAREYDESVEDDEVTVEDHHEIASEMLDWLDRIKNHCSYISDMISTVKGQAVQHNTVQDDHFSIDEFIKRVELLMKHELKQNHCILRTDIQVGRDTEISGNVNSLVQIFDNLIINAVHAYEGENGFIDLCIRGDDEKLTLSLTDYAKGIAPEIQSRLFREMVTTKGKMGTGLGLYLSHSTIKGIFNGQMSVASQPGTGTCFTIELPRQPVAMELSAN
ncbi:PAS domain-containing protein [Ruminococcaceae bacterium OttesenSCG-928-L11]|nr:PAS domain-containing protein [Ruminococcaceae bacterium OttesenSCG-928-L11]